MAQIIEGVSTAEYHSILYPQVNHGKLRAIERSPLHAMNTQPYKSDSLRFGSAFHLAMQDMELFQKTVKVYEKPKRCAPGQEAEQDAAGLWVWKHEEDKLLAMYAMMMLNESARMFISCNGRHELTVLWDDDGVECKCRPDKVVAGGIIDWKTTEDASPDAFTRSVKRYGYDTQAAWYLDGCRAAGMKVDRFVFVAVEKDPPYGVAAYDLSFLTLAQARERNKAAMDIYRQCKLSNQWPCYSDQIITLEAYSFENED